MNMKMKTVPFFGIFFLIFVFFSLALFPVFAAKPSEKIVIGANLRDYKPPTKTDCDIRVPKEYSTIQAGVDAAVTGDTVCVDEGTYNEDVVVNKSIRLSGRGDRKTIINGQDPNGQGTVSITTNDVTLEGFLINGVGTNFSQTAVAINGSDSSPVFGAIVRYNRVVAGNGEIALRTIRGQDSIIQNNILEGNNSPYLARTDTASFLNNTFIGTINQIDRQDTGITLDCGGQNCFIKQNVFNTSGTMLTLIASNDTGIIHENNFNSNTIRKLSSTWGTPVNAENNWWGDLDPSDNTQGSVDFTPFATSPFTEY